MSLSRFVGAGPTASRADEAKNSVKSLPDKGLLTQVHTAKSLFGRKNWPLTKFNLTPHRRVSGSARARPNIHTTSQLSDGDNNDILKVLQDVTVPATWNGFDAAQVKNGMLLGFQVLPFIHMSEILPTLNVANLALTIGLQHMFNLYDELSTRCVRPFR
jgi:hypothetical protein